VTSAGPGQGSTFTISLPVLTADDVSVPLETSSGPEFRHERVHPAPSHNGRG
jgi:hypothetical protein